MLANRTITELSACIFSMLRLKTILLIYKVETGRDWSLFMVGVGTKETRVG